MTGKGRIIAVVTALGLTVGLTAVPIAAAYTVPIPVGLPGGGPTASQGGSSASQRLTHATAASMAGFTGLQLALRTPFVKFKFPKAASTSCSAKVATINLGSGTARKGSHGSKYFKFYFTNSGRAYLYAHNTQAIPVTIKCAFVPKHGKKSTSTSTVVLAP